MAEPESALNPKPIISLMLAVSVGFWASELATYFTSLTQIKEMDLTNFKVESIPEEAIDLRNLEGLGDEIENAKEECKESDENKNWSCALLKVGPEKIPTNAIVWDKMLSAELNPKEPIDPSKHYFSNKLTDKKSNLIDPDLLVSKLTVLVVVVSGVLFLLDLLCIVWWYARYIYRIQPDASFGAYFLDFVICSMFALAANSWTDPRTFVLATVFGSLFLGGRFWRLYQGPHVSLTDRQILSKAGIFLGMAILVAVLFLAVVRALWPELDFPWYGHAVPGLLSAIGILLTVVLKNKIDVAVAIYAAKHVPSFHAHLSWPASKELPNPEQRARIRERTSGGLRAFDELFRALGKHDCIQSRVHSETDLRIQSYILAVPSCEKADYAHEIENKAFMVAVSHWLDDLVDGRNEVAVFNRIQDGPELSGDPEAGKEQNGAAGRLFEHIYRPLVRKHTDKHFYDLLDRKIRKSCRFAYNHEYMFLGLNRVAYGSVIFSPKITEDQRADLLTKHNVFLKTWNVEREGFAKEVEEIIDEISRGGAVGSILLGLTTKTVQEVAMSSEGNRLNIGLSILYSILYAPLVYYHNMIQELEHKEMVPLEAFDTDYDIWIPWVQSAREAIDKFGGDERKEGRTRQTEMAYKCFRPMLPRHIRSKLRPIYMP